MDEKDDRLNFENNATIKKIIGEEKIIFSDKITKINVDKVLNKSQERNILITNLAIYNIKGDEKKRRIRIDELQGITISKLSHQFIIHCNQNEYDYLFISKSRKKIIKILQTLFKASACKDLLFCQKNDKELEKYTVGKKERRKSIDLFKIEQSELTSINDYLENDENDINQEENRVKKKSHTIQNDNKKSSDDETIMELKNIIAKLEVEKKELINELNIYKNINIKLNNELKDLQTNFNERITEINNLKKEKIDLISEINDLKTKIKLDSISPDEKIICIQFKSIDEIIDLAIPCKNTDLFFQLENQLYERYPQYKGPNNYFTTNGIKIERLKSLEDNKIKNSDKILLNKK